MWHVPDIGSSWSNGGFEKEAQIALSPRGGSGNQCLSTAVASKWKTSAANMSKKCAARTHFWSHERNVEKWTG